MNSVHSMFSARNLALLSGACLGAVIASLSADVAAQAYPGRPLRWVIPFPPGGGADYLARIVGQKAGEALGQQIVIDNRGGAAGNIAAEVAAKAARGRRSRFRAPWCVDATRERTVACR